MEIYTQRSSFYIYFLCFATVICFITAVAVAVVVFVSVVIIVGGGASVAAASAVAALKDIIKTESNDVKESSAKSKDININNILPPLLR